MRTALPAHLILLPLLVWLLLSACTGQPGSAAAQQHGLSFVIPPGTAAARIRGEPAFSIPEVMELTAGQSITIRNDDQAMHYFFYAPIAPGQTFRKTFAEPGRYGYSGLLSCSVADFDTVTVIVNPPGQSR